MTPFALRIMHIVRQKEHGSHEAWFQAIVDETIRAVRLDPNALTKAEAQILALLDTPEKGKCE